MTGLTLIGLLLDLVGVVLLGFDLVRIQRKLRRDAEERIATLAGVVEANEGVESWMNELGRSADWREYQRDDGGYWPVGGTFDSSAAQSSFKELGAQVAEIGSSVHRLAHMMSINVLNDQSTAHLSLKFSYIGLALVVIGFALQGLPQVLLLLA